MLPNVGGMQERLGGDAADVQAGAAELGVLLDKRGLQAVLSGANGRRVTAGAAPDDDHIICHFIFSVAFAGAVPGVNDRSGTSGDPARLLLSWAYMLRVRFAPSPTGYLHIGSARTFIFNWLYARHNHGTMILRIDDTDVERNTQVSLDSIFDGLNWLGLGWDELYRQSDRLELHRLVAEAIFAKGLAYRDFTAAVEETEERGHDKGPWLFNPGMREMTAEESDRRAAAGEPFVLRFRVPREPAVAVTFEDAVYGPQTKSTADIEDFALLRSNGMPTYHMASCADDADLRISHIIRGQDHLSNTFKHVLIFRGGGRARRRNSRICRCWSPRMERSCPSASTGRW